MSQGTILAIDDDQSIRHLIKREFSLEGFEVTTAESGEHGLMLLEHQSFDVVLLDIMLPKMRGMDVLKEVKQRSPNMQIIMVTGYGDISTAVESMKLGARDYVTKPFKLRELSALVKQAVVDKKKLSDIGVQPVRLKAEGGAQFIQCPSPSMQNVYGLMKRIALTDKTVLISGETGVGKDVLALQIHLNSLRKDGPFITLDCGLINQNLAESELYGHRKGAFSGASEGKIGLVEKSHNGSIFLDEIGNIDLELQKKFLRFLETRRFRRVGEINEIQLDARVILATNMNLEEGMRRGTIRRDLFYRMDVVHISIPPLRDRREDIGALARYFLRVDGTKDGPKKISPEAIQILTEYSWLGNTRELKSIINKTLILTESDIITPNDLPSQIFAKAYVPSEPAKRLEDMEKEHIMAVLMEAEGNQTKAAEILGINRKTLYKKIHKYQLFS